MLLRDLLFYPIYSTNVISEDYFVNSVSTIGHPCTLQPPIPLTPTKLISLHDLYVVRFSRYITESVSDFIRHTVHMIPTSYLLYIYIFELENFKYETV